MNINNVIDWIMRRDDIVIAQPEKFVKELRERFDSPDTEGFLEELSAACRPIKDKYVKEGLNNHMLVVALCGKNVKTIWGGSVKGIAEAYATAAINDEDYIKVMSLVSQALLMNRILGHDTD